MTIKDTVLALVTSEQYYQKRFPTWRPRANNNVECCFHEDTSPSLAINLHNGGAKCHAASCGKRIGNIVHFEAERLSIDEETAAHGLYVEFVRPILSETVVERFHKELIQSEKWCDWIAKDTGISRQTIRDYKIGLDLKTRRVTFPIKNRFGEYVNLRMMKLKRHRLTAKDNEFKVLNYVEDRGLLTEVRYGGMELFSWPEMLKFQIDKPIFIMASEKETLLARQMGLQACCATNGEGSWDDLWSEDFVGADVHILFDQDKGGEEGAKRVFASVQKYADSVTIRKLRFSPHYRGDRDFDDWVVKDGGTVDKIIEVVESEPEVAPMIKPPVSHPSFQGLTAPKLPGFSSSEIIELNEARNSIAYLDQQIITRGIVAAVSPKAYNVPWRFRKKEKGNMEKFYYMEMGRELVDFIGVSDQYIKNYFLDLLGKVTMTADDHIPMVEIEIIPVPEVGEDSSYVVQRCFAANHIIEPNIPYKFHVIPITTVRTQEKIFIIVYAEKLGRGIDVSLLSKKDIQELEIFQPTVKSEVYPHLCIVANYVAETYTLIHERPDWHIVALLSYLSPLQFKFPRDNEQVQRGWMNALAIGDTKTGKSKVVESLQQLLQAGEIVNAENCTYVGLVGGAIKSSGGNFMLRWGRIPLCDKQLVVLEELSGLDIKDIANMSDLRSSGIARLDKGGLVGRTVARTRLICLSNVRPANRTLAEYTSGVRAVQELIGHAEDISRFDLIITLTDKEVSSGRINKPIDLGTHADDDPITPELFQRLCRFVWSLKAEDIEFQEKSYLACLKYADVLGKRYHSSVPLFKSSSDRYKIGRIACAIAAMQFSWSYETKKLIVREDHVDAAVLLLQSLYDKPSLGYLDYSKQMQDRESIKDINLLNQTIAETIKSSDLPKIFESLIHLGQFNQDELSAIASLQIYQSQKLIGVMMRERALRKGMSNLWEITPTGKRWMETVISEGLNVEVETDEHKIYEGAFDAI